MDVKHAQQYANKMADYANALPPGAQKDRALEEKRLWDEEVQRLLALKQSPVAVEYLDNSEPEEPRRRRNAVVTTVTAILVPAILLGSLYGLSKMQESAAVTAQTADSEASVPPTDPITLAPVPVPNEEAPETTEPVDTPPTSIPSFPVQPPVQDELKWKNGDTVSPLPATIPNNTQVTPFLAAYPDAEAWMNKDGDSDMKVVFTDSPEYNCGVKNLKENAMAQGAVAGCYNPQYGKTVFVYWSPVGTSEATREFVLAHEYSHFLQWWNSYDTMRSIQLEGYGENVDAVAAVEADASCRVLSWGGYSKEVADSSSSPCTVTDWKEGWLTERTKQLGITIKDY